VKGSISYSTTGLTNQNVVATISFNKSSVKVTNNGERTDYTFTGNGNFTFEFIDVYGNTGQETATVSRIDKTPVTGTITYSPNGIPTSGNVIATLTTNKVVAAISGWNGTTGTSFTTTFTDNVTTKVVFSDFAGNTGFENVVIHWIDTENPSIPIIKANTLPPYAINTPEITFTVTDNVMIASCKMTYIADDGITGTTSGNVIEISSATSPQYPILDPDTLYHTITISCQDTAGNKSTNSIIFPPVITFTTPTLISNTSIEDATVTINTFNGNELENIMLTGTIP
jgi:hypothetical protein